MDRKILHANASAAQRENSRRSGAAQRKTPVLIAGVFSFLKKLLPLCLLTFTGLDVPITLWYIRQPSIRIWTI